MILALFVLEVTVLGLVDWFHLTMEKSAKAYKSDLALTSHQIFASKIGTGPDPNR